MSVVRQGRGCCVRARDLEVFLKKRAWGFGFFCTHALSLAWWRYGEKSDPVCLLLGGVPLNTWNYLWVEARFSQPCGGAVTFHFFLSPIRNREKNKYSWFPSRMRLMTCPFSPVNHTVCFIGWRDFVGLLMPVKARLSYLFFLSLVNFFYFYSFFIFLSIVVANSPPPLRSLLEVPVRGWLIKTPFTFPLPPWSGIKPQT